MVAQRFKKLAFHARSKSGTGGLTYLAVLILTVLTVQLNSKMYSRYNMRRLDIVVIVTMVLVMVMWPQCTINF